jgi:hypothetical protein
LYNEDKTVDKKTLRRLMGLRAIVVTPCSSLRSAFFIKRADSSELDITRESEGSLHLLMEQQEQGITTLFIVTSVAQFKWLPNLAMTINKYLGGLLSNLQPVEKMLTCDQVLAVHDRVVP